MQFAQWLLQCLKTLHKWQRSLGFRVRCEIPLVALQVCAKGQAEAGPWHTVHVLQGRERWHWVTLSCWHSGLKHFGCCFALGGVPCQPGRKHVCKGWRKHQKGGELQHVEKEQTKGWPRNHKLKAESPLLPCLARESSRSWKLCWDHKVASGVKMQSLGLDPWAACTKKGGGL